MSVRTSTWVWEQSQTTGNDRLLMLALADEADDDGTNCFPSQDRLERKARVPKRTIQRATDRLEALGELVVDRPKQHGRGHFNAYILVMGRPPEELPPARPWEQEGRQSVALPSERNGAPGDEKGRVKARPGVALPIDPTTSRPEDAEASASARRLADLLADRIRDHRGGTGRPKITDGWIRDMDLLLRRGPLGIEDARPLSVEKVEHAIGYLFDDLAEPGPGGFCWADVIQSPGKLRAKYQQIRDERHKRERSAVPAMNPHFRKY